jgi:hypothetical protein
MVRSVLHLHKDEMQARTEPSIAPHFNRGDKVCVSTTSLFLRGQTNMKLRDRHLGPFTMEEHIAKHSYILKLLAIVRLHLVFHVNILRPCYTAPLRPALPVTVPKETARSLMSPTSLLFASSRYMDDEANICSS